MKKQIIAMLCVLCLTVGMSSVAQAEKDTRTDEEKYEAALQLIEDAQLDDAAALFKTLDGYEDSERYMAYAQALGKLYVEDHAGALAAFAELGDFEYSNSYTSYLAQLLNAPAFVSDAGLYALVNQQGELVSQPQWNWIELCQSLRFSQVPSVRSLLKAYLGPVTVSDTGIVQPQDGAWGLIDGTGALVVSPVWQSIDWVTARYAGVTDTTGSYVLDLATGEALPGVYEATFASKPERMGDLIVVQLAGKACVLNAATGELMAQAEGWDEIDAFLTPYYFALKRESAYAYLPAAAQKDGKTSFLAPDGTLAFDGTYENAYRFAFDRAPVCQGGLWGLIDLEGREVLAPTYEDIDATDVCGVFVGHTAQGALLLNGEGDVLTKKAYDKLSVCPANELVIAVSGGLYGLMDYAGKTVLKPTYEMIQYTHTPLLMAVKKDKQGLLNGKGKAVVKVSQDTISASIGGRFIALNTNRSGQTTGDYYDLYGKKTKGRYICPKACQMRGSMLTFFTNCNQGGGVGSYWCDTYLIDGTMARLAVTEDTAAALGLSIYRTPVPMGNATMAETYQVTGTEPIQTVIVDSDAAKLVKAMEDGAEIIEFADGSIQVLYQDGTMLILTGVTDVLQAMYDGRNVTVGDDGAVHID